MTEAVESSEGRKARQYKTKIANLMADVLEVMEEARQEGFTPEFSIQPGPDKSFVLSEVVVVKRW